MTKMAKDKDGYAAIFAKTSRDLTLTITILMSLGMAAITAIILGDHYDKLSYWLCIALALIAGAGAGFIECLLLRHLLWWLMPTESDAEKLRLSLIAIVILTFGLAWVKWQDIPTNAQIDKIHNDPRFAAAIAEINDKQGNADLFIAAMKNGHTDVNRYVYFGIEVLFLFVGLLMIFGTYWVIYRVLLRFFGPKSLVNKNTSD